MENNAAASVQAVDLDILKPIVRKVLGRDTFEIQEWSFRQLGGGIGNPVSVGLYRFEGTGQAAGEMLRWSVVLKIIQSPANVGQPELGGGDDQSHWNYWKREPLLYQSGLLDSLPAGMIAPRFFGMAELPGDMVWLWLEDITDAEAGNWSLERYALTARHFGRMNGVFAAEHVRLPHPWFGRGRLRTWINLIPWRSIPWEHPLVRSRYPNPVRNTFRRMLEDRERFLARLEALPQTVCHGDTYPTNFMSRRLPDGEQQTVALDWALTGIAALGEDLGQLIYGTQMNLKEVDPQEVDRRMFESYLVGLQESGLVFDPPAVRFAMAAGGALQIGLFQLFLMSEMLKQGDAVLGQIPEPDAQQPDCFEVVMANEAYRLLEVQ